MENICHSISVSVACSGLKCTVVPFFRVKVFSYSLGELVMPDTACSALCFFSLCSLILSLPTAGSWSNSYYVALGLS